MYKKNIENTFEIGSHKIETEFFELDKLKSRVVLRNALKEFQMQLEECINPQESILATHPEHGCVKFAP